MLLIAVAVFSLFAMNRTTLMPLFADQVLHVGAHGFGFLLASMGLGSLTGALTLAFFPRFGVDPRRQLWMAAIWVAALLEFSSSRVFVISLVTLFVAGYCQISFVAAANTRIQTLTPDHLRGRVMALYAEALIGVGPVGATQAGALATLVRAPRARAIGATIAGAGVGAIRLLTPQVFGQPSQTSRTAATGGAGPPHPTARTQAAPPPPADRTRLDRTGRTMAAGMALLDPARNPASAPTGKPIAAMSNGKRRIHRRGRKAGRAPKLARTTPIARRSGCRSPASRASRASRENPLKPMRSRTTATTVISSANHQRNSAG